MPTERQYAVLRQGLAYLDINNKVAIELIPINLIGAPALRPVVITDATYNLISTVDLIVGNRATDITITLSASSGSGRMYFFKNINTGNMIVNRAGADIIDDEISQTVGPKDDMLIADAAVGIWVIL